MDLNKPALFAAMKQRLDWISQRQSVLAQNIANADTPFYQPHDIQPFRFSQLVAGGPRPVTMTATDPAHLGGQTAADPNFAEKPDRRPLETAPAGNAVVLEEQMAKVNETSIAHRLTTELYRKHLGMIRIAIGARH